MLGEHSIRWAPGLRAPDKMARQIGGRLPLFLFLAINGLVLYNALFHHPLIGYDGGGHALYVLTLAQGRLPGPYDTHEFFSPPLPYLLPAPAHAAGLSWMASLKLGQWLNLLASLATIATVARIARLLRPHQPRFAAAALTVLATLPVYYKSFAFVRGEPWVALFTALAAYEMISLLLGTDRPSVAARGARLGLWLGLAALSRQWGFLVWAAVALFTASWAWRKRRLAPFKTTPEEDPGSRAARLWRHPYGRAAALALLVALVTSAWYYGYLHVRYGSVAAFNRPPQVRFALSNQPAGFYTGFGSGKLFSDPVRPSFPNELWPKFYAELWGDYEAYFLVTGRDLRNGRFVVGHRLEEALAAGAPWLETNRASMGAYLGRANRVALGVSGLLLASLALGARTFWRWWRGRAPGRLAAPYAFLWTVIAASVGGFLAFLILYPNPGNGDTIKATYLLHVYPLLALLAAEVMETTRRHSRRAYLLLWMLLGLTALYLSPAFITRYVA